MKWILSYAGGMVVLRDEWCVIAESGGSLSRFEHHRIGSTQSRSRVMLDQGRG